MLAVDNLRIVILVGIICAPRITRADSGSRPPAVCQKGTETMTCGTNGVAWDGYIYCAFSARDGMPKGCVTSLSCDGRVEPEDRNKLYCHGAGDNWGWCCCFAQFESCSKGLNVCYRVGKDWKCLPKWTPPITDEPNPGGPKPGAGGTNSDNATGPGGSHAGHGHDSGATFSSSIGTIILLVFARACFS